MATQFLASKGLSALRYYLPADPRDLNLVYVPTAADLDAEPYWLDDDRRVLGRMGFNVRELDIKGLGYERSKAVLELVDVLFVAGGNTFHLLNQMQLSGFGAAVAEKSDLFYVGGSAGAVVAGPTIEPVREFDRPEIADPPATTEGLGLVPFVVMPHYDESSNGEAYAAAAERYKGRYEFVTLTDSQAVVVVDGGAPEILTSRV